VQQAARCAHKGYAAVVLDYASNWGTTGLTQTLADWETYIDWMMSTVKNLGLPVGPVGFQYLANATLLSKMEFAVAWMCVQQNNCANFMPLGELFAWLLYPKMHCASALQASVMYASMCGTLAPALVASKCIALGCCHRARRTVLSASQVPHK
jgi:hypothetical protein